jgi:hypothetical protein
MDSRNFAQDKSAFDFTSLCESLNKPDRPELSDVDAFKADLLGLFQFCSETRIVDPLQFQIYATQINNDNINRDFLQDIIAVLVAQGYNSGAATIVACVGCLYNLKQITANINSLLTARNQTEEDTLKMFLLALPVVLDKELLGRTTQHLIEIELEKICKKV